MAKLILKFHPIAAASPLWSTVVDISDDESRTPRTITLGLQDPFNAELSNPISATLFVTDTDFLGIELELNATPFEVRLGEQITYTYRVSNRGTVMLENIRIEDDHGTSFPMGSIFPSQTITGAGGTLASEEDLSSPIERTAVVTATDELGESVMDSDSASVTVVQYKTMLLYVERQ